MIRINAMTWLLVCSLPVVGCAAGEIPGDEEASAESQDALVSSCLSKSGASPGSPEWSQALRACVDKAVSSGRTPAPRPEDPAKPPTTPAPPPAAPPPPGAGGGKSCSTGVTCINGTCTCSSDGPNKGKECNGAASTGADSCSVFCKVCN